MKDKEKQIEEMAKEIEHAKQGIWANVITREEDEDYLWHSRRIAEHLTILGYQKVDKDSVILTKAELNQIQANFFDSGIKYSSKETASEIIEMFSDKNYITEKDLIKAIAKRYGVKIKND